MSRSTVGVAIAALGLLVIGCSGSTGPKQAATPTAIISIDADTVLFGQNTPVNLRMSWPEGDGPKLDSLAELEFAICYDTDALRFIKVDKGPAISNWEYFTYRTTATPPLTAVGLGNVLVVAFRDLNNGEPPDESQCFPSGILATLTFYVAADVKYRGTTHRIGFSLQGCKDNTMAPVGDGRTLYVPDTSLGGILYKDGYDTIDCPYVTRSAVLELRGGAVLIVTPTHPLRGDIDLNGIAFEVRDAVMFANYFNMGYAAFDPERASEQIAATDCDGDGEPLTQADWEVMIRSITGQVPLGDTLAVPYQDTLLIRPRLEGDRWILSFESTIQVDELWFKIIVPASPESVQYLGEPPAVVSLSTVEGRLQVACGTVSGQHIFGPGLGDRFEVQGYSGYWFFMTAQASRYPGVAMKVRVLLPY